MPMADPAPPDTLHFLEGGGDMGARMRAFDWTTTPLEHPRGWPLALRTLVSVMLGSGQPMFIAWGPQRTMLYNDAYAPLCGSKHPAALGRPFGEVWAEIIDAVGPIMDRAYAGVPTHMDDIAFTMVDRRGYPEETHFAFSYTPVRDRSLEVAGMFCACTETTERVLTERRLRFLFELSDRLRDLSDPAEIMHTAAEALGTHLRAGRVGYSELDESGERFTVERDWTDGVLPSMAGTHRAGDFGPAIAEQLRIGRSVRSDDAATDDRTRHALPAFAALGMRAAMAVPLVKDRRVVARMFVHSGSPRWWSPGEEALARNVAERTWDAVTRARSVQELRDEHRHKDEFLAMLAHELRNPLAPLRSGLRVLARAEDDRAAVARVRRMMDRQIGHMVRLIDDLLDVSRVSRGLVELCRVRVDLADVVASAVETSTPAIEAGGHELSIDLAPGPLAIDADPTRLSQVVANLLNNAAKYTPAGGRIRVEGRREGDQVVVRVSDNGIGIPAGQLQRIFDLFTQLGTASGRAQGGLGIGLTLAQRLTELHGGTVAVESSGAGSTFTVRLPAAPASAAGPEAGTPAGASPGADPRRRVLVVDDNADAADMLATMIALDGHAVVTAASGPEAIEQADRFRPDVVLLDIGLPGMDGYQVARALRARASGASALLAAVTGWGADEDKQRARDAGFDLHLTKPVDPDAIGRLLAR
jgi:signal transduction histidine kinase